MSCLYGIFPVQCFQCLTVTCKHFHDLSLPSINIFWVILKPEKHCFSNMIRIGRRVVCPLSLDFSGILLGENKGLSKCLSLRSLLMDSIICGATFLLALYDTSEIIMESGWCVTEKKYIFRSKELCLICCFAG